MAPASGNLAIVEVEGLEPLMIWLRRLTPPEYQARCQAAMWAITSKVLTEAVLDVDKDTGGLAQSLVADVWLDPNAVWGTVLSPLAHAIVREKGRRAGAAPPPEGALLGWMGRHGWDEGDEDMLRWSIARKGSLPHPFLVPALLANRPYALHVTTQALMAEPRAPGARGAV